MPVLAHASNGPIIEKLEGVAVDPERYVYIVNDNDGVDDNSGETQFINLGKLELHVDEEYGRMGVCLDDYCMPCGGHMMAD